MLGHSPGVTDVHLTGVLRVKKHTEGSCQLLSSSLTRPSHVNDPVKDQDSHNTIDYTECNVAEHL